jgi:DNA-binding transcriptional LysR family regulator
VDLLICMKNYIAVVNRGGFSAASRKLFVSPSKLSKQVSWLEKHLGVQLLKRSTRHIELTEIGQVFYEKSVGVIDDISTIKELASHLAEEPHGLIRISSSALFGQRHITPLTIKFMKSHPKIEFDLMFANQPLDMFSERVDIAISLEQNHDPRVINKPLCTYKRGIFGAPRYFKKHSEPKTPKDLINHNCIITTNWGNPNQWRLANKVATYISGNYSTSDRQSSIQAAVAGVGLILTSTDAVMKELHTGKLVPVLEKSFTEELPVYIIYSKNSRKKIDIFINFLMKNIPKKLY